jgi:diguanylate cyclase (GGDEF)-like protein
MSHGIIWLLGLAGIGAYNFVRRREIGRISRQQELEHLASTDALTGLANRRTLMLRAEQELARAKRYGSELSLLMADIDFFKKVNDTYGHQAGDLVLKKLAGVFLLALRDIDFAARFGGEEFVLLLPETNAENALKTAERLRASVNDIQISLPQGELVQCTISIGVASYSSSGNDSVEKLISGADKALYAAKETGRNKVCLDSSAEEQHRLES